jgi:type 1 fimbriae regulatory protein FimB/type 1 fimbriae regulatory protein FimE
MSYKKYQMPAERNPKQSKPMNAVSQSTAQASQTGAEINTENDPFRENYPSQGHENAKVLSVAFTPSNTPFRECARKPPRKPKNADRRSREFLTPDEIELVIKAASSVGRHRHRDSTLILVAYRHGLRVSELVSLRWEQVDLKQGLLHVRRKKNGTASSHPLHGPEIRAIRRIKRGYPSSPYLFTTERRGPLTTSTVRKILCRAGEVAGLNFPIHPHMLRHATGYKLANDGQDTRAIQHYLGHRNICHTVIYTNLSPDRFKNF